MTTATGLAACLTVALLAGCAERVSPADGREQAVSIAGADAVPACATNTTPGDHSVTCGGLRVDLRVPTSCPPEGCGLILVLHGDTGTGLLEDAHVRLREQGAQAGYVVVAPTGPPFGGSGASNGSTWSPANDATLIAIVGRISDELRVDRRRIHVTGFSRGGYSTWRLMCDHADVFASAAPAAAGATQMGPCFGNNRFPSRKIPILLLIGRTDAAVTFDVTQQIRDAAIAHYGASTMEVVASDANYSHRRWTGADGALVEVFEHGYETAPDGPWGWAKGHCFPGSTTDPNAPQYALPCRPPNAFVWGDEVLRFFREHPMP